MAKSGRLERLARLGGLSARVATGWVSQRVRSALGDEEAGREGEARFQIDSSEAIVATLARLRGAAMKVGQGLSLAAQHLDLPDEVRRQLDRLQRDADPVPFAVIRATLASELSADPATLFALIDPVPLGTASLAQAHAARLPDGREVVIKVLHDGVAEAVSSDLLVLRAILQGGRAFGRSRAELSVVYDEVRERLLEELDYLQEAANLQAFGEAFSGDEDVRIPRHVPSLCTERVLVLDRVPGMELQTFIATASREAQQRAGLTLARLFLSMAFDKRLLHCDPHPGNYIFTEDGVVGLIDFGCVKRFDVFWMGTYARVVRAAFDQDRDALLSAVRDVGAWSGDDPKAADAIWDFCQTVVTPLRGREVTLGIDDVRLIEKVTPVARQLWSYPEITGPRDILFLHRTLGGMYTIARQLRVRARWDELLLPYLDRAIAAAEGRSPVE